MSFGGNKNAAYNRNLRNYMKSVPDSKFESYVGSRGDLANAWRMIDTYQKGGDMSGFQFAHGLTPQQQAEYWIKKAEGGRFTKADFGRFHAAEDKALLQGKYPGGTKVKPGTKAYDDYFKGKDTTYHDDYHSGGGKDNGGGGGDNGGGGGQVTLSPKSFILQKDYTQPKARDWSRYIPSRSGFGPNQLFGPVVNASVSRVRDEKGGPSRQIGLINYQPWSAEYHKRYLPGGFLKYAPAPLAQWKYRPIEWEDWEDFKDLPTEEENPDDKKNNGKSPPGSDEPPGGD